eukprot:3940838-Rhodomonas_salina.1
MGLSSHQAYSLPDLAVQIPLPARPASHVTRPHTPRYSTPHATLLDPTRQLLDPARHGSRPT